MVVRPALDEADAAHAASQSGSRWRGNLSTRLRRSKQHQAVPSAEFQSADSAALLKWLLDALAEIDRLPRLVPADDPHSVHEFADRLFAAYNVEKGSVHMAGCHLEDRPFLRLSRVEKTAAEPEIVHRYFDEAGNEVEEQLAGELHLADAVQETEQRTGAHCDDWAGAVSAAKEQLGVSGPTWRASGLVLVKHARGNLRMTIGGESLDVPFVGWTRTLAAPKAKCPATGVLTFNLASLDDGRIVAAEQVIRCEASGKKILKTESVVCSVTSQRVDAALCRECPVTGKPAQETKFANCPCCGQEVSQIIIGAGGCAGCLARKKVSSDDERLARVLTAAPKLTEQKRYKLSETRSAIIVETGSWRTRLLVVLDKASGKLVHAAKKQRLSRTWTKLNDTERTETLG